MMSVMSTNRAAPTGANGFFGSVAATFAAWNDARVTRNSLSKLSDRELDDIGLCRGDIEDIATGR
jgi:uncharacterized protein YjiS (DUF1127 family)